MLKIKPVVIDLTLNSQTTSAMLNITHAFLSAPPQSYVTANK